MNIKYLSSFFLIALMAFVPVRAFAAGATLSLSPASGTFNKGCSLTLEVKLDSGGSKTDGTDAILFYDASRFTASSVSAGSIYSDYPGNNIDPANGTITIAGIAAINSPFTGQGTLATISLTVKEDAPLGLTQIKFDFDPADKTKTTDSNVIEQGTAEEILSSVSNGSYTIGTGNCMAAGAPVNLPATGVGQGAVSTPSAQIPVKTLPEGGTQEFTFMIAILGSALTVLGILGLALL